VRSGRSGPPHRRGTNLSTTSRSLALVLAAAGCAGDPGRVVLLRGDAATFASAVQPVYDARCADPSCHGRADRPLAIYSPTRFRRDPARTFIRESLDPEEIATNVRATAAFALDAVEAGGTVDDSLVLRKPLPEEAGGAQHGGGVVFSSQSDREWRALRDWGRALASGPPDGGAP
jgi:hypothetical protein